VLDVLGVLLEPLDQLVVVGVCLGAKGLVALEHHHRGTVGVELVEHFADALKGLQRRRIGRAQRHVVFFADRLELWHQHVRKGCDGHPEQHDRHAEPTNPLGDPVGHRWALGDVVAHPDLSRQ
jgi:hypothetical protein